jgi:glycosyltransferase involved in cell wall biosynthesis
MRERNVHLVSVIIPTYNSARTLPMALRSIKRQKYPSIEIIIVDKYSRDSTPHIAFRFGAHVIQADTERAEAKNIGLKLLKANMFSFYTTFMATPATLPEYLTTYQYHYPGPPFNLTYSRLAYLFFGLIVAATMSASLFSKDCQALYFVVLYVVGFLLSTHLIATGNWIVEDF